MGLDMISPTSRMLLPALILCAFLGSAICGGEEPTTARSRDETEHLVAVWLAQIGRTVKLRNRLEGDVQWEIFQEFKAKILQAKEFGGKADSVADLTPLEQRMLDLLRKDMSEKALFTDHSKPLAQRLEAFENMDDVQRKPYALIGADLAPVVAERYAKSVTPEQERAFYLMARTTWVLDFLMDEVQKREQLQPNHPLVGEAGSAIYYAVRRMEKAGAFAAPDGLPDAVVGQWSEVDRALYAYFRAGLLHDPAFANPASHESLQRIFDTYLEYRKNPDASEEKAHEAALKALIEHVVRPARAAPSSTRAASPE